MAIRKWPWGRIVAGTVATIILLLVIPLFFTSADIRHRADEARKAELLHLKADLSKSGTYSGRFLHNFAMAHGNYVQVVTAAPSGSYEQAKAVIEGLAGRLTVTQVGSGASYNIEFGPKCYDVFRIDDNRWAFTIPFHCSTEGDYELKLTIDKGAPRLAGVPHSLVVRYQICGMEYCVAQIACLLGIAGCAIAGILILVIVIVTIKKRGPRAS
jgi:hypothetical protein